MLIYRKRQFEKSAIHEVRTKFSLQGN